MSHVIVSVPISQPPFWTQDDPGWTERSKMMKLVMFLAGCYGVKTASLFWFPSNDSAGLRHRFGVLTAKPHFGSNISCSTEQFPLSFLENSCLLTRDIIASCRAIYTLSKWLECWKENRLAGSVLSTIGFFFKYATSLALQCIREVDSDQILTFFFLAWTSQGIDMHWLNIPGDS